MLTSLDNPAHGVAINIVGWVSSMALAPLVFSAAAILALTPRYPTKPKNRE